MSETTPRKVFCSHASPDKPAVEEFARRLREERGIDAWFDLWEITPGDDVVRRMDDGLASCDAALIFLSHATGKWMDAEVSTLIHDRIEAGKRVIPVLMVDDAPIRPLLRPLARRGIAEFDAIADALADRNRKPALGGSTATQRQRRLALNLEPDGDHYQLHATLDDEVLSGPARLPADPALPASYTAFVDSHLRGVLRNAAASLALHTMEQELTQLGQVLGRLLFPDPVGERLQALLEHQAPGEWLALRLDSADPRVLALPVEAARLPGGTLPALQAAVTVLRRHVGVTATSFEPAPGPLKILVALGAPDEGQTLASPLDLERETQHILDAVAEAARRGNAQVRVLEVSQPAEIQKALEQDTYHVLHLSGHGRPGEIELEDEEGRAVQVSPGDLLSALGQGEGARRYYEQSLAIRERLSQAEPDRADYQEDLVVSYWRMADVEPAESIAYMEKALIILTTLHQANRLRADLVPFIEQAQQRLDTLRGSPE